MVCKLYDAQMVTKKEHSLHSEAVLPLLSLNYILATLQDNDKPGYTNFIPVFWG
jgi:hypothetical protein